MGKSKRLRSAKPTTNRTNNKPSALRRQHSQIVPSSQPAKTQLSTGTTSERKQSKHSSNIPFKQHDRILLIGEGDMSFALSLVAHHKPKSVTVTCYDSREQLLEKYPGVVSTLGKLDAPSPAPDSATDYVNAEFKSAGGEDSADEVFEGFSPSSRSPLPSPSSSPPQDTNTAPGTTQPTTKTTRVLFSIDATRLPSHRKTLHRIPFSPFTKIVFNFPHTGGLSTDVNRQVRANQELLVKFLESCKPFLHESMRSIENDHKFSDKNQTAGPQTKDSDRYDTPPSAAASDDDDDDDDDEPSPRELPGTPQVLITLFEGQPYELWGIRNLARHCGYIFKESFRFPWGAYPGYSHARTLGDIVSKNNSMDKDSDGVENETDSEDATEKATVNGNNKTKKKKQRWRGEDRDARMYILELKEHQQTDRRLRRNDSRRVSNGKRKRGGSGRADDDEDSD